MHIQNKDDDPIQLVLAAQKIDGKCKSGSLAAALKTDSTLTAFAGSFVTDQVERTVQNRCEDDEGDHWQAELFCGQDRRAEEQLSTQKHHDSKG